MDLLLTTYEPKSTATNFDHACSQPLDMTLLHSFLLVNYPDQTKCKNHTTSKLRNKPLWYKMPPNSTDDASIGKIGMWRVYCEVLLQVFGTRDVLFG